MQAQEGNESVQSLNPPLVTAFTKVTISVEDINDNCPFFNKKEYFAEIDENISKGVPLSIKGDSIIATDKDQVM